MGTKIQNSVAERTILEMAFPFFMLSPVPYVDIFVSFLEKVKERI